VSLSKPTKSHLSSGGAQYLNIPTEVVKFSTYESIIYLQYLYYKMFLSTVISID